MRSEQRRLREIARREKQKAKPKFHGYLAYLVFLISLVYMTDEIASQIGTLMKTEIANDLMARFGERSVGALDIVAFIAIPFQALSIFYKPLSDRFGRRLFLVLNTLGMSAGMLLIAVTDSLAPYVAGAVIIQFFVPHDMQVVYIMESAPPRHRAKLYSTIKCVATLGVMLVPLLRRTLMQTASQWRAVYLVPAVVGLVASFAALLFAREPDAFLDARLAALRAAPAAKEKAAKGKAPRSGFFAGLVFALRHKQLRWVFIATALCNFGVILTMHYQVVLSYGYASHMVGGGLYASLSEALEAASVGPVTTALFLFPVGSALAQLLVGYAADAWGRKRSALMMTALVLASFVGFTLGANFAWPPALVGMLCGMAVGGFWGASDLDILLAGESAPTALRASVLSAQFAAIGVGYILAYGVGLPLITRFGNASVPFVTLGLAVPGMAASLAALAAKVHETRGVNLDTVTGCEWDPPARQ